MRADARRRGARDYGLALEAAASLATARIALALMPFQRIVRSSVRNGRRAERTGPTRACAIGDVCWAIAAAAARLPGRTVCFPRALAAQAMLRRRGVSTTLTYGARTRDGRLDAHVWLTAGDVGIVGHEVASDYPALAIYASVSRQHRVQEA